MHAVNGLGHVSVHLARMQLTVPGGLLAQANPHPLQLARSLMVSTQLPAQSVSPALHMIPQTPSLQTALLFATAGQA